MIHVILIAAYVRILILIRFICRSLKNYLESSDSESDRSSEDSKQDHGRIIRRKRFALAVLLLNDSIFHKSGQGPQVF